MNCKGIEWLGLDELLLAALREDVGTGDITTMSCIPAENRAEGRYLVKEDGVLCGLSVAERVFALIDPAITLTPKAQDGDHVKKGDVIATVSGPARGILTGERVGLNLMQRMSGVATMTAKAVSEVAGTKEAIVDTR